MNDAEGGKIANDSDGVQLLALEETRKKADLLGLIERPGWTSTFGPASSKSIGR